MKIAFYGRVNRREQTDLHLSSQLEAARKYCGENNMQIDAIYTDICPVKEIAEQHQLLGLLSDSRNGFIKSVVVSDRDRLTRKEVDYNAIKESLNKSGVKLIICSEP